MRRSKKTLTWIAMTMLLRVGMGVSAEGSAAAQSAPARSGAAGDSTLARIQQDGAAVGPELRAAQASLGGNAKQGDGSAAVDWNGMAERGAAADGTTPRGLSLPSGTGRVTPSAAVGGQNLQTLQGDATGAPSTGAGQATRVAPVGSVAPDVATMSISAAHPEAAIRGQISPVARSCFESDTGPKPKGPVKAGILIKVDAAGAIESVNVSSNVDLTPAITTCITTATRALKFAAPGVGGATVRAALTLWAAEDDASPSSGRAKDAPAERDALKAKTQATGGETARR
jgi:hypothetical protein